jgi:hypothetical protein
LPVLTAWEIVCLCSMGTQFSLQKQVADRCSGYARTSTLHESEGRLTVAVIEYDENGEQRIVSNPSSVKVGVQREVSS